MDYTLLGAFIVAFSSVLGVVAWFFKHLADPIKNIEVMLAGLERDHHNTSKLVIDHEKEIKHIISILDRNRLK